MELLILVLMGVLKFGVTGIYLTRKELMNDVDGTATFNPDPESYKTGSRIIYIAEEG